MWQAASGSAVRRSSTMLQTERSVVNSLLWKAIIKMASSLTQAPCNPAVLRRSRRGRLPRIFLCVAVAEILTYRATSASTALSPTSDSETALRTPLGPSVTDVATKGEKGDPSASFSDVSTCVKGDTPSTLSAQKAPHDVEMDRVPDEIYVSDDREVKTVASAERFSVSPGREQPGLGPVDRLVATTVSASGKETATNGTPSALRNIVTGWQTGSTETLSPPSEIQVSERLQEVRRQQQWVRQHLEQLLAGQVDLAPITDGDSNAAQTRPDRNTAEFTSQPPDWFVTPGNGAGNSSHVIHLEVDHISTQSGKQRNLNALSKQEGGSEDVHSVGNVSERLARLQKVQSDLKAEEDELQWGLDRLLQKKAEQHFQHQTQDRAVRAFHSRFEQQTQNDETEEPTSKTSRSLPRSHRRRSQSPRRQQQPGYLQLKNSVQGYAESAGTERVATRGKIDKGLHEDEAGDSREAVSSEDERKFPTNKGSPSEESTRSLEERLGHAIPVVPHDRTFASSKSDRAPDITRPRQRAAPLGVSQHDTGAVLLEVLRRRSLTSSAKGFRGTANQTPPVRRPHGRGRTMSRMEPNANDLREHGSRSHRRRRDKKWRDEARNVPFVGGPSPLEPDPTGRGPPTRRPRERRPMSLRHNASTGGRKLRTKVRQIPIQHHDQNASPAGSKPAESRVAHRHPGELSETDLTTPEHSRSFPDSRRRRSEIRAAATGVKATEGRHRSPAGPLQEAKKSHVAKKPLRASERGAARPPTKEKRSDLRRVGAALRAKGKQISSQVASAAAKPMLHDVVTRLVEGSRTPRETDHVSEGDDDLSDMEQISLDDTDNNEAPDRDDGEPDSHSSSTVDKGDTGDEAEPEPDHEDDTDTQEATAEDGAEDHEDEWGAGEWSAVELSAQRPRAHMRVAGSSSETHSDGHHAWPQFEDASGEGSPWQSPESEEGYEESDEPGEYEDTWDSWVNEYSDGQGADVNGWHGHGQGEDEGTSGGTRKEVSERGRPNAKGWHQNGHVPGGTEVSSPPRSTVGSNRILRRSLYMEPKVHKHRPFEDFGSSSEKVGRPDWIKEASTSANAKDVQWSSREKLQIHKQEDVYNQAHDTIAGLDYLGAGYDILKGNPLGDPETSVDPGFRDPVLRFYWSHNTYGVTNDLNLLQPLGGFVRPFVSCRRSETAEEVSSMSDYQNELSVDAKVEGGAPFVSFSAGTSYKDMAREIAKKDEKTFFLKTYCFRYEAGLASAPQIKWNTTYGFEQALRDLSTSFDGLERGNGCPPSVYKLTPTSDVCKKEGVTGWMSLFEQYGTHVTNNVKLGGKIVHSIRIKKKSLDTLKDKGVSVSAAVSAQALFFSGGASTSTSTSSSDKNADASEERKVTTYVIGGRPPKDPTDPAMLVLWSKTVEDLPMPIQTKLQPLSVYMPPKFREAYDKALVYYSRAFGMSQAQLDLIFHAQATTVAERLRAGHSVVWGGAAPGYVECPGEELVVLGLAIVYNFRDLEAQPSEYHVTPCETGRRRCDGPASPGLPGDEARIWAVCAPTEIVSLRNIVVESVQEKEDEELELKCPTGMEVMVGLKLAAGYGPDGALESYVEHCVTGKGACSMSPRPSHNRSRIRRFIYAACLESTYPGLHSVHAISSLGDIGKTDNQKKNKDGSVVLNCGPGQVVLFGWTLETHTRAEDVRNKFVNCTPGQQMCIMKGAGVNKAASVGAVRRFTDVHALLGYCLCVLSSSYNSHPAAHSTAIKGTG